MCSKKNVCCGYSKELSQSDDSFEDPQQMLKFIDKKKKITILCFFKFKTMYHLDRRLGNKKTNRFKSEIPRILLIFFFFFLTFDGVINF